MLVPVYVGHDPEHVFVKEQNGYEGGPTNPRSWERTMEKPHWPAEAFADEELRIKLIGAVERLDSFALSESNGPACPDPPICSLSKSQPGILVTVGMGGFSCHLSRSV